MDKRLNKRSILLLDINRILLLWVDGDIYEEEAISQIKTLVTTPESVNDNTREPCGQYNHLQPSNDQIQAKIDSYKK